jgi:hypothetical protein
MLTARERARLARPAVALPISAAVLSVAGNSPAGERKKEVTTGVQNVFRGWDAVPRDDPERVGDHTTVVGEDETEVKMGVFVRSARPVTIKRIDYASARGGEWGAERQWTISLSY